MTNDPEHANTWRTSTYSGSSNDCVQAANHGTGIAIRDSKDPHGTVLTFTADAWHALTQDIKAHPAT
jgi:hypothetical protein